MDARRAHRLVAIEIAVRIRKCTETANGRVDKPHAAAKSAALEVVIRSGELNQTLKILLEVRLSDEPDLLPRFVSLPELRSIEVLDPAEEMRGEVGFRPQSPSRVPRRSVSQSAEVKSAVVPVPPMSRVRCSSPAPSTLMIEL